MKFKRLGLIAASAAVAMTASSASAAVIFSENFETATHGGQNVPGWTLTPSPGSPILILNSQDYRNCCGFNDTGTGQFIAFNAGNSPAIGVATTPTIHFLAGHAYSVAFDYGMFQSGQQGLEVRYNASVIGGISISGFGPNDLSHVLGHFNFINFTATGPGTLSFLDRSTQTNSVDSFLDNVAVSGAVPEPSSWALLLLGFAGLGFASARSHKRRNSPAAA